MNEPLPAFCQSCERRGPVPRGKLRRPSWCVCKNGGGPYVAPPGEVMMFVYLSPEEAKLHDDALPVIQAYYQARDALSQRWVRCGRGWRELPKTSPKRRQLERAYRKALRAWEAMQAQCTHPYRSLFARECCGVCGLDLAARSAA